MTENHTYNTPGLDTQDWHIPNNANFEDLDTDVEVRDTDANRSNYTPKSGAKYLATDTGEVFLGDGTNWNSIGSVVPSRFQASAATMSASQSISDITVTKLQFDTAITDALGAFDATNHRFVAPADGTYLINVTIEYAGSTGWATGNTAKVRGAVNGTAINFNSTLKVGTDDEQFFAPPVTADLLTGDAVTAQAYQNSGSSQSTKQSGKQRHRFEIVRVS